MKLGNLTHPTMTIIQIIMDILGYNMSDLHCINVWLAITGAVEDKYFKMFYCVLPLFLLNTATKNKVGF